jgi:hypothetical protein
MSLLENTNALLEKQIKAGRSLVDILRLLNGKVERDWFYKFAAGKIHDPSVNRIQTLHDSLKRLDSKSA